MDFTSILGAVANTASNVITSEYNLANNKELMAQQHRYNETSAENAYNRQKQLITQFYTPGAQVRMLEEAGLSPSLMYGGTGQAGSTSAPQAQGVGLPQSNMQPVDYANIMLANAQARKLNAEAEVVEEKGKEEAESRIAKAYADAGNAEAATALTNAETSFTKLNTEIATASKESNIYKIFYESKKVEQEYLNALEVVRNSKVQADIAEETKDAAIKQIRANAEKAFEEIGLTTQQIEALKNQINTNIDMVKVQQANARTLSSQLNAQVEQWAKQNGLQERFQDKTQQNAWISSISHILGAVVTGTMLYFTKNPSASIAAGAATAQATQATQTTTTWF